MTFPNHTLARLVPDSVYQDKLRKPAGIAANRNVTVLCEPVKVLRPILDAVEPTEEVAFVDSVSVFLKSWRGVVLGKFKFWIV